MAYTFDMEPTAPIEDSRGVDVSQIRELLRMTVAERVRYMVEVTNKLMDIHAAARFVDPRPTR